MNDDLGPEERTLGTALSRAVEAQSVRGTRFEDSRLGVNMNKPKRGSFLLPAFAAVAAILVGLFVGTSLLDRGTAPISQVAASPTPTATATGAGIASPAPTSGPTQAPQEEFVVWFARDQLPPVPGTVSAPGPSGAQSADRISARVRALWDARPSAAGSYNEFRTRPDTSLKNVTTTVSGDVATVVIEAGRWDGLSSAETIAVVQQLVYTITEEPGISRAALREPGKDHAQIGSGIQKDPMTREDVAGYNVPADKSLTIDEQERAATAATTVSNNVVAPALGRFTVELRPTTPVQGGFWTPPLRAELSPTTPGSESKWALSVTLPGVTDPRAGSVVRAGPVFEVEGSPISSFRVRREANGVTYELYLDDARPWRIGLERGTDGTMRVLVDVGGHPSAVTTGTAVYLPSPEAEFQAGRRNPMHGLARAFEATVSWRVRDSAGREVAKGFANASIGTSPYYGTFAFPVEIPSGVSGNVTLEVFQASPRDGSDTNKVEIPLQVR